MPDMARFRTLTQRFGALYALVLVVLLGVGGVVLYHLETIRIDSRRLVEEAREQAATSALISTVDGLLDLLEAAAPLGKEEIERAAAQLRNQRQEIEQLETQEDDPSRRSHQEEEERVAEQLHLHLVGAEDLVLHHERPEQRAAALEQLRLAKHYAQILLVEARSEGLEANDDLQRRASWTRVSLLILVPFGALLLTASLIQIQRAVVQPLRELQLATSRFGAGDSTARLKSSSPDEIGLLSASFNRMADQIVESRAHLEERVRQRTQQFIRAARLADLGVLASGIAHELNTPLASIASSAEGLARRLQAETEPDPALLDSYSQVIVNETERAREITTRMLGLARQDASEIARIPLQLLVEQAVSAMGNRSAKRGVGVHAQPVEEGLQVQVNPGEIVQVLVNLLANAIDASEPGQEVVLTADVIDHRLLFRVRDHGSGIPQDQLERIWDPFFSTKAPGEGTGLGLALVSSMVHSRQGTIAIRSQLDEGTLVEVDLPAEWEEQA